MILNDFDYSTYLQDYPDKDGYFGKYGGIYIDKKLTKAMEEITEAEYNSIQEKLSQNANLQKLIEAFSKTFKLEA